MIVRRWNHKKRDYDPYMIPSDWKCRTSAEMDEIVNCASCGREVEFGDCYSSLEIHGKLGFGYSVCPECYEKEVCRNDRGRNR